MRNERAWPRQCWKSCANRSNTVALRFGDHGTKELWKLLAEKSDQFQTLRNNTQQHPTTCNRVCKRTQHACNIQQYWELLANNVNLRPFARGFRGRVTYPLERLRGRLRTKNAIILIDVAEKPRIQRLF